jgi:predicted GNAT family N-acyltransferase
LRSPVTSINFCSGVRWSSSVISVSVRRAFRSMFRSRARASQELDELMKTVHPTEPHWYLFAIGSDPTVRGAGFGQALMHSRIDRCDAEHAPAYLEATKQETVPYYMRFGFEATGEIEAPDGGPSMDPMWRAPR